jgi:hypothetical protein
MLTKNDRRYCVYTLRYRGIPFYIGKGLPNRPKTHYYPSELKKNHPKNYILNNFDTYITIEKDGLTNDEANAFEKQLIEVWGYENLTNKTRGGSGTDGRTATPEHRAKMTGDKNPMYGRVGDKHPFYGKNHTPEALAKISGDKNPMYGRGSEMIGEKNPSYDATVRTFQHKDGRIETCTQFELRTKYGLTRQNLSKVVNGKRPSCDGWRVVI